MHTKKRMEAFHEPERAAGILPAEGSEKGSAGKMPAARCSTFTVPIHGIKVVESSMNHARASNRSLPWKSGAEHARTPNADASSADFAGAKRLECSRNRTISPATSFREPVRSACFKSPSIRYLSQAT